MEIVMRLIVMTTGLHLQYCCRLF